MADDALRTRVARAYPEAPSSSSHLLPNDTNYVPHSIVTDSETFLGGRGVYIWESNVIAMLNLCAENELKIQQETFSG